MVVTEKEVALYSKFLGILFNGVADKLGAYDLWLTTTWEGPPPIKDEK